MKVFAKQETQQPIQAFKLRGAFVACWQALQRDPSIRHFAAASAGNHGQGVAHFVHWYNERPVLGADGQYTERAPEDMLHADIFCAESASQQKVGAMSELGATIHQQGLQQLEDASKASTDYVSALNNKLAGGTAYLVPPFDHADVMAGQATVLLETVMQLQEAGVNLCDQPLVFNVAWGGGGLGGGCAVLMDRLVNLQVLHPDSCVIAAQMENCDSTIRALAHIDAGNTDDTTLFETSDGDDCFDSSADGTAVRKPGELNLPLAYYLRSTGRLRFEQVSKSEVGKSMFRALLRDQTLEPAGALADAARAQMTRNAAPYLITQPEDEFVHVVVQSGANLTQETQDDFVAASIEGNPLGGLSLRVASSVVAR